MDGLGDLFNQQMNSLAKKESEMRDAGKKKIEYFGVREVFDHIVSQVNLPLDQQTENFKNLTKRLVEIAKKRFKQDKHIYLSGELEKVVLKESEAQNPNYYLLMIMVHLKPSDNWKNVSRCVLLASASGISYDINIIRNDSDEEISIITGDKKEDVIRKVLELIS